MKKILISLLFVLPFLFSCQQPEVDPYTPGEEDAAGCYGVYFPSQEATGSHTLDPTMAPQATFTAMRKNTSGAITVPLKVTASENVFDVGTLSFADGQSESTFTVNFPNTEMGTSYNLSIAIEDPQYASKYLNQPIALDYSVMRVEWQYVMNPKTNEKAKIHWVQDWWGEEVDTYVKYYEVNGVRTCFTETIPESHYYKGFYTGYGFFGTGEDEASGVEWTFTWYPNRENSIGGQFIQLDCYTGYHHSSYDADVWACDYFSFQNRFNGQNYTPWIDYAVNYGDPDGGYDCSYYDGNGGFYLSVYRYYMAGVGGWNPGFYDVVGIAEGFTRLDFSVEAETDYSHEGEVPVYLTLGPDVANIKFAAYPGELTPTQVENKTAAIVNGSDPSQSFNDFEAGDGVQYADLSLNLGETGFYTLVVVTFDKDGAAQESTSIMLNYVSADDEETYKVIVDCATEEVPERYSGYDPLSSFAYYVIGEDLTDAHVAIYKMSTYQSQQTAVLADVKNGHAVDAATLAQINANGGWFTVVDGLNPDTEYIVLVWATNGKEEAYAGDTWKTDPLPYVWKDLGKGQLTDDVACGLYGIDPQVTVSCNVFEEENHPGLYKINGFQLPLVAAIFEETEEALSEYENVYWRNADLIIDAQNPEDVRIDLQDYGVCLNTEDGFIDGVTSVYRGEPFSVGTLSNGVIAFPTEKGMLCTLNGDGYYYANQHGAFKVVLPNAT